MSESDPVKLYYSPLTAPSRGALLAARVIEVPIQIEFIDIMIKEHLSESFAQINPQQCVPTMDDDGFVLWESNAIASYLADKYGKDDQWYPKDLKRRTLVNQILFFNDRLNEKIRVNITIPFLWKRKTELENSQRNILNKALNSLEQFLSTSKWLTGDKPTIADTSNYASVTGIIAAGWDLTPFPNTKIWVKNCKSYIPGVAETDDHARIFRNILRNKYLNNDYKNFL